MKKALIVGIDNYSRSPLFGCVNDANNMSRVLEVNADGSKNFDVELLTASTNDNREIFKRDLKRKIQELFNGDCDISLFYFAGHGCLTPVGGYIITSDGTPYDEGISMSEIITYANSSKSKNKIIILDCCSSGALGKIPDIQEDRSYLASGVVILTACRDSEASAEIDDKGVFTSLVIEALEGGAADPQGCVTTGSIYSYVDRSLGAWQQRPVFKSNTNQFIPLRTVKLPAAIENEHRYTKEFEEFEESWEKSKGIQTVKPVALAVCLIPTNPSIKNDVKRFLDSNGWEMPIEELNMEGINSKQDISKFIVLLKEKRRQFYESGVTEMHLFIAGPVQAGTIIGAIYSNWIPVKIYHRSLTESYEYWTLLKKY
ncbi:MAG: caspase family protein [Blastocatellia bacterium]|jgi:hypothetical protein|nr:caspase family protein [Blastocatellia bacterium]